MKCYLCKTIMKPFMKKNGYMIFQCPSCGLGMTDLKKSYTAFVEEHYQKGYFTGDPALAAYANYKDDKAYIVRNMKKFLAEIHKMKPGGKLLDVGCAMGFFVELAVEKGYDAYGFDPSQFAVHEAKKLVGSRIKRGTIQSVQYSEKTYDVITLFDVFEHLGDPVADIKKLTSYLKDDGIIVIATGNTHSIAAKILKRRWTFYCPPQHIFFFNRKILTEFLAKQNLLPVHWFQIGKWLSLRYILHLARTLAESNIAKVLYPTVEKLGIGKLPLYLPMGDNMVVIARKRIVKPR